MIKFPLRDIKKHGHRKGCEAQNSCKCWKQPEPSVLWSSLTEDMDISHCKAYGCIIGTDHLVIDVDPRRGGDDSFKKLIQNIPDLPIIGTYAIDTGRGDGGKHYYFKLPYRASISTIMDGYDGIEFRSGNQYVVGVGSIRGDNGNIYTSVGSDEILETSQALLDFLKLHRAFKMCSQFNKEIIIETNLIKSALFSLPVDQYREYDKWLLVGRALFVSFKGDDAGLAAWTEWSETDPLYYPADTTNLYRKWESFSRGNIIDDNFLWQEAAKYNPLFIAQASFTAIPIPPIKNKEPSKKEEETNNLIERTAPKEWIYITKLDGFVHKRLRDLKSAEKLQMELSYCLGKKRVKDFVNNGTIQRAIEIDYLPNKDEFIKGPLGYKAFNMWFKPELEAINGDITIFTNFLTYFFGADSTHLLDWMAMVIQGIRPKYMCIIYTKHNQVGKGSFIGKAMRIMLGNSANCITIGTEDLTEKHNDFLQWRQFGLIEELFAPNNKLSLYNRLKTIITDDEIKVNPKFVKAYEIRNMISFMAFTNNPDAMMMKADDVRFFVLSSDKEPKSKQFYIDFYRWLFGNHSTRYIYSKDGAISHLYYYLLHRKVAQKAFQNAPVTVAQREMATASMSNDEVFLEDAILSDSNKNYSDMFVDTHILSVYCREKYRCNITSNKLTKLFKRLGYVKTIRLSVGNKPKRILISPTLMKNKEDFIMRFIRDNYNSMIVHLGKYNDLFSVSP